jgi:hypothetical protein
MPADPHNDVPGRSQFSTPVPATVPDEDDADLLPTVPGGRRPPATLPDPAPAPPAAAPPSFGKYQLLEVVVEGGMGIVFRAHDTELDRVVALKMIRPGALADPAGVVRFCQEARAAGKLNHHNIVPVLDSGQHDGRHYFTMPFAVGGSLAQHRERLTADPRAAVALVEKVARAVHFAHSHGILHRDLKPGNVLLDEHGEPLVADFGLAKFLGAGVELTQPGEGIGTPAYMAPEQAGGRGDRLDARTDVWALGVLLYELLAGRRPFPGLSREEVTREILTTDPPPLRAARPGLGRDLETVVRKCLEKEPARRYATAEALADELGRWRAGEPVHARPPGPLSHGWRLVRRHPTLCTALGLLAAFALLAALLWLRGQPAGSATLAPLGKPDDPWREPVTVIGDNGKPARIRWLLGDANVLNPRAPEDPFAFHTFTLSLLEAERNPPKEGYRFSAEIRHVDSTEGFVGLIFGYSKHETDKATHHCFGELIFADRGIQAGIFKDRAGNPGSRVVLNVHHYYDPKQGSEENLTDVAGVEARYAAVAPGVPTPWRQLAVEVTPEKVRVFWEGQPLGEQSQEDLAKAEKQLQVIRPHLSEVTPEFGPGQPVGLVVYKGVASFRRVEVRRLPADN